MHIRASSSRHHAGIDYLHVPWVNGDDWIRAVRADVSRTFSPQIRYRMYAAGRDEPLPALRRIYFDVRDS